MNRDLLQRIFTLAYTGLRDQGFKRSLDREGGCAYRGEQGRRCAIGHVIADAHYSWKLEGLSVTEDAVLQALACSLDMPVDDVGEYGVSLKNLQNCHDAAQDAQSVRSKLEDYAVVYALAIPT